MKCRSFFQHATYPSHAGQYLLAVQVEKHDAIHESAVFVDPSHDLLCPPFTTNYSYLERRPVNMYGAQIYTRFSDLSYLVTARLWYI